jgi:hypothetical protein
MLIEANLFYVSHVFLISLFEVIASLSDVRQFTCVACDFLYPTLSCSYTLPFVLGLVRPCIVLVFLKNILTFLCLDAFLLLRLNVNIVQVIISMTVLLSQTQLLCMCCNWKFSLWVL